MDINVFAKFDESPSLPVQDIKEKPKWRGQRITKGNNSKRIVDINVFAKFDENLSLPVQVIKEKPKCRRLSITKGITLNELVPRSYFSIINVHLVDINVFAKFYEIPAVAFLRYWKTKSSRLDGLTDNVKTVYPPKTQFARGMIINYRRWLQDKLRLTIRSWKILYC